MPQITLTATKSAIVDAEYPNVNNHSAVIATIKAGDSGLLLGFTIPEAVRFKVFSSAVLHVYAESDYVESKYGDHWLGYFPIKALSAPFDADTVTFNTTPALCVNSNYWHLYRYDADTSASKNAWHDDERDSGGLTVLAGIRNGIKISTTSGSSQIWTEKSSYKPYFVVNYIEDENSATIGRLSPASGFVHKASPATFSWRVMQTDYSLEEVKAVSTTFRWRAGSSGAIHTIACGTAQSVTVPAGTFTADEIQWSVAATLNTGATVESDWCALSTVEALSTAEPVSPAGIVIDGTAVNRFSWQHIIVTGTAQTKAELQQSTDGSTWSALATVTGADTYWDAPADTFTAGTKYWRVRTYNTDNAAGSWSDAAEFIAINAPSTPSISIQTTGPRPTIAWQTSEQQAYEVALSSGYRSGTQYGTAKTWTSPFYLDDGSYTVRVRVQNQYGLWSEWGEAALPVVNAPGEAITLTVMASQEAVLIWQTAGSYDYFVVERDGVAIARVTGSRYTDLTSIGTVRYRVRGCYAGSGNYGISDTQSVDVRPEWNMICELAAGEWLDLRLSETQTRANGRTHTAQITTVHLLGLAYPVAEAAEFRDLTLSVSCAFPRSDEDSARALEALVGRLVCLKTPEGSMATGYLAELQSDADEFMRRYAFSIENIHRQEEITLDA